MFSSFALWTIHLICPPSQTDEVESLFEGEALAVTLTPSQEGKTGVEILVDGKPDEEDLRARLGNLPFTLEAVGDLDWLKEVAQDFPPLTIARWTIFGAAHRDKVMTEKSPPATLPLQINATSAFGTGEHPTTRGCLLLLDELLEKNEASRNVLDMGCGSGILAMAFAKASSGGQTLGVDMDEISIAIARENAETNGLRDSIRFEISMGYENPLIQETGPFDLVMANILADPLCEMAADLAAHLKPGGTAILSGILGSQDEAVLSAHKAQGLSLVRKIILGEWSALELRKIMSAS